MMERRTTRSAGASEFLCLCIALGDKEIGDEVWDELRQIPEGAAETMLTDLERLHGMSPEPALEAAQLFLKDRIWMASR